MTPNTPILRLIAKGSYIDEVKTNHGKEKYLCTVYSVALSGEALNKYNDDVEVDPIENPDAFDAKGDDYLEIRYARDNAKANFKAWICGALGIDTVGVTITQNVSEIFTVTQIKPLE